MFNLPIDPAILILTLGIIVVLILYFREYRLRQQSQREGQEFLASIQEKGWESIHESLKKSQEMLGEAELESLKVVTDSRVINKKIEDEYKKKVNDAYMQLLQFMNSLQQQGQEIKATSEKLAEERINKLFTTLEERLSDFLVQTSQKTSTSLELELKASRSLIESYKQEQLKLIDENILAMMEQTLNIVLGKKLSLKDQVDLVYEALEKAKIEKFVI